MYHAPLGLKSHKNHNFKPLCLVLTHAQIQEFSPGGSRSNWQKSSDNVFFFFFFFLLVLSLFYRSQMVYFKENYHFHGSRGGPTFTRGVQLLSGGGGCPIAYSYRNPYNLWFSRGGGGSGPPVPPLDPHLWLAQIGTLCLIAVPPEQAAHIPKEGT